MSLLLADLAKVLVAGRRCSIFANVFTVGFPAHLAPNEGHPISSKTPRFSSSSAKAIIYRNWFDPFILYQLVDMTYLYISVWRE